MCGCGASVDCASVPVIGDVDGDRCRSASQSLHTVPRHGPARGIAFTGPPCACLLCALSRSRQMATLPEGGRRGRCRTRRGGSCSDAFGMGALSLLRQRPSLRLSLPLRLRHVVRLPVRLPMPCVHITYTYPLFPLARWRCAVSGHVCSSAQPIECAAVHLIALKTRLARIASAPPPRTPKASAPCELRWPSTRSRHSHQKRSFLTPRCSS